MRCSLFSLSIALFSLAACTSDDAPKDAFGPGLMPSTAQLQEFCASAQHELPVVTHWNATADAPEYLASDSPNLYADRRGPFVQGQCYPEYGPGLLPDFGSYLGDTYATEAVADSRARDFFQEVCEQTGVRIDLMRPDAFETRSAGLGRLKSESGRVQILHARIIDGSLATIMLPPNWSFTAPQGEYPIVVNGFYDINSNMFGATGQRWTQMTALSGIQDRSGVIGVLWNGGGALAGRTANEQAFRQFNSVIQYVAANFSGDRHRIFMSGGSRGGLSTVNMASNPYGYDYSVVYASATATPTQIGEHAALQSTTFPGLLPSVGWSTGFTDAWRTGWRYPACAGRPELTGLTGPEAHSHVIVGTSNLDEADRLHSPISQRFLDGLKAAGTKLFVTITASDNIVPYSTQVKYGVALLQKGIPVSFEVLARAGHHEREVEGLLGYAPVRFNKMIEELLPHVNAGEAPKDDPVISYFARNRESDKFEAYTPTAGFFPFSVDTPYKTAPGQRIPLAFVGHPATDYKLNFYNPEELLILTISGSIPDDLEEIRWIDVPMGLAAGDYAMSLAIRKPGKDWQTIPATNTITGEAAIIVVDSEEPNINGWEALEWANPPALGSGGTNWGLSEY